MKTLARRVIRKLGRMLVRSRPLPTPKAVCVHNPYEITISATSSKSPVDDYWGEHTVRSQPFAAGQDHLNWLRWRSEEYPLSYPFKGLWNDHHDEVMLDYGCGPGHDVVGFSVHSRPRKIYGIDISRKALTLAGHNLALQQIAPERVQLIQTADLADRIPLPAGSVNYVHCCGVLHHTSSPGAILQEFHRVLSPAGQGLVMVYNRDSLWFHLYAGYARRCLQSAFAGMSVEEVFTRSTDGPNCPISRCYREADFTAVCRDAGFVANYVGGFLSRTELDCWLEFGARALQDHRCEDVHRSFLKELEWDEAGLPLYRGKYAGIGGVYRLRKCG